MATCEACLSLEGKPAQTEPHEGLIRGPTLKRPDGEVERYTCRKCGSRLQRLVIDEESGGPPQVWARL